MRTLLSLIVAIVFLVLGIIVSFFLFLIGLFNKPLKDKIALKLVQGAFGLICFFAGAKKTVIGRENIPDDKPVLYVANHQSFFDIIIGYRLVKGRCGFVAKKEMLKVPLLRHWMKLLYCLFLDRENIKEGLKTILQGIDYVKNQGISMWIFPEGTRNKTPEEGLLPFKEGALKIAEKSGCPIIPVAISNTANLFENHLPWMRRAKVTFRFGEPILLSELEKEDRKHAGAYVQKVIENMLESDTLA
jgi:1-acyl-sn-glycerol-3-phosphate acyltransferase